MDVNAKSKRERGTEREREKDIANAAYHSVTITYFKREEEKLHVMHAQPISPDGTCITELSKVFFCSTLYMPKWMDPIKISQINFFSSNERLRIIGAQDQVEEAIEYLEEVGRQRPFPATRHVTPFQVSLLCRKCAV